MNKIIELERELEKLKNEATKLKNEGKIDEALAVVDSINAKKEEIKKVKDIEAALLDNQDDNALKNKVEEVSFIHAYAKSILGKPLSDAEDNSLICTFSSPEIAFFNTLSSASESCLPRMDFA